jgi:hypothetical protein
MNNTQFVENLVEKISWAKDIYLDHISDYHELLSYLLMEQLSDVFIRIANEAFVSKINIEENLIKIRIFLDVIENGIHMNSDEVRNLIIVSFLENIHPSIESFSSIKEMMGDFSRSILEEYIYPTV